MIAMKRYAIAGIAAGAAMMIGGALGAVSNNAPAQPKSLAAGAEMMNPMVGGQAILCWRIFPPRPTIPRWWRR